MPERMGTGGSWMHTHDSSRVHGKVFIAGEVFARVCCISLSLSLSPRLHSQEKVEPHPLCARTRTGPCRLSHSLSSSPGHEGSVSLSLSLSLSCSLVHILILLLTFTLTHLLTSFLACSLAYLLTNLLTDICVYIKKHIHNWATL